LDSLIFVVVGVVVLLFKPSQKRTKKKFREERKKLEKLFTRAVKKTKLSYK